MPTKQYRRGIFIGRFQPFHIGHINSIKSSLSRCAELIICVGSPEKLSEDNPFSLETRFDMIKAGLKDSGIDANRVFITYAPDFESDEDWFDYILRTNKKFEVAFTGNSWVGEIFERNRIKVEDLARFGEISGTNIRALIKSGGKWKRYVTKGVATIIKNP